jgi:hypothetical protein
LIAATVYKRRENEECNYQNSYSIIFPGHRLLPHMEKILRKGEFFVRKYIDLAIITMNQVVKLEILSDLL